MAELRRFGVVDFLLLILILALAAGVRAGYLITLCDNGHSPGPLRVQDTRLALDRAAGQSGDIIIGPGVRGARNQGIPDWKVPRLAGYGGVTDLDDLVTDLKSGNAYRGRTPVETNKEQPSAYTSPGYPWILGLLGRVLTEESDLEFAVRWGQCGLGALAAAFYFLFARRAFGSRLVAILAGIFCAVHPFWVIDTATLDDGVISTFLLSAVLFFGVRGAQASGVLSSLLYGLGLAALALVRAALLPFSAAAFLWYLLRCREIHRGWLCALLAFLGFANGLAPWMVFNWNRFRDVIPIVDSMYAAVWEGNYNVSAGGKHYTATGGPASPDAWLIARTETAGLTRVGRYNHLAENVEKEIGRDPTATVNRRISAGLFFFLGEGWVRDGQFAENIEDSVADFSVKYGVAKRAGERRRLEEENKEENKKKSAEQRAEEDRRAAEEDREARKADQEKAEKHKEDVKWVNDVYPIALSSTMLAMLILGVLGWRWTYGFRTQAMPASLAMMLIPIPYILSHAEFLSGPRLPLDGVLLTYAAFAVGCFIPRLSQYLLAGARPAAVREREVVREQSVPVPVRRR
jgi:hypothetical protein